ncbi:MAG: isoaspartyl peptidase/L-asparaginase [Cytophagales bacterium]|nr:isoaspartyl peptidase/L-asparaginase [Bernardetiaceae bacterium]MDW8209680.1 isoaspartyl peptidase/L-asparaginase [Cytophagales bacterium]
MKHLICLLFSLCGLGMMTKAQHQSKIAIAVHGGAGTISKANMTPELEKEYTDKLDEAVSAGYAVLQKGGTALEAVATAIEILENSPLFNAGKGAVLTNEGTVELDASVMDGKTLSAGAVAGVTTIKNPILAAIAVMQKSPHVMMTGRGAETFAQQQGLEIVPNSYFLEQHRYEQWKKLNSGDNPEKGHLSPKNPPSEDTSIKDEKFGTVGCVALDQYGNLAAGTSTGGMMNKRFGRIGDSPIIGAGTYANNQTCAVSATGHGEYFIRAVAAYDIAALMAYKKMPLKKAAEEVVMKKLVKMGGQGGVIAIDRKGNIAMPFNSQGMYRACIYPDGRKYIAIYKE